MARIRSFKDRGERIAARNDRVRLDALKILGHVLRTNADNAAQVQADAALPKTDAPFYLHAATQIASDSVRREVDDRKGPGTTLNVLIMGQAPSNEAWLEAVKQQQAPKVIEATALPVKLTAKSEPAQ